MKSIKFLMVVALVAFFTGANAQLFVGGSMGIRTNGGTHDNGNTKTDTPSQFGFNLNPKMGYFLSEKVAVGAELYLGFDKQNDNEEQETIRRATTIGFAPFVRYYVVTLNKFSVFGTGSLGISHTSAETKFDGAVMQEPKTLGIGFSITPGLAYNVTERFALETTFNFLNLGYNYSRTKEDDIKDTNSNFHFGAGLDNITTVGNITIGAIYRF